MRTALIGIIVLSLLPSSADAAGQGSAIDPRLGTFIGAQVNLPFGGKGAGRPRAGVGIAPTRSRFSSSGMIHTDIGEGLSLSVAPGSKPTLTLVGLRADEALGFKSGNQVQAKNKLGISTGGWIAIGVGSVALIVGGLYLWGERLSYCEEEDHHC